MSFALPEPMISLRPVIELRDAASLANATDVIATFPAPVSADLGHSLPGRLRGALGEALLSGRARPTSVAVSRRRRLYAHRGAFEQLFEGASSPLSGCSPAQRIPPYTVASEVSCGRVVARIRLFGRAGFHAPEVAEAFYYALVTNGVSLAPLARSRFRVAKSSLNLDLAAVKPTPLAVLSSGTVRMVTLSPFYVSRGKAIAADAAAIIGSGLMRASGLLAWCGFHLQVDTQAFSYARRQIRGVNSTLSVSEKWHRVSRRRRQVVELFGMRGGISLAGLNDEVRQLLPLIEMVQLGQRTTAGFGCVCFFHET